MDVINKKPIRIMLNIWSLVGILLLLFTAVLYLKWNGFGEQGEVNFATVSWLLQQGYPLYTDIDFPARYSLQHGPIVYLLAGYIMKLFGPSYITAKLSGVIALLVAVFLSWQWFSKLIGKRDAFLLLGLEVWILFHWHHAYFIRPDSMMLLCMMVTMYIVTTKHHQMWLILGTVIPLAVMTNLKIHGVIYFLPIIAMLYPRLGWKKVLYSSGFVLALVAVPFLSPAISFPNYLLWLFQSFHHGFRFSNFIPKVAIIIELFALIGTIAMIYGVNLRSIYVRNKAMIVTLLFSLLVISIIASKGGSGTNHIMPFIPFFCYFMMLIVAEAKIGKKSLTSISKSVFLVNVSGVIFLLLAITVSGVNTEKRFITSILADDRIAMVQDVHSIEQLYKGKTMEIGYGGPASYSVYRDLIPLPVFAGNPLLMEIVALEDMTTAKIPIPASTIKSLENGNIQVWLIPKGDRPFSLGNGSKQELFDQAFVQAFFNHYTLVSSTAFFDIWMYRDSEGKKE